jgi:hypothetical protein
VRGARQLGRDGEARAIRQHHVEQDDVGPQRRRVAQRRGGVAGLPHDRASGRLQQPPGEAAKAGVIVDDQRLHGRIVSL